MTLSQSINQKVENFEQINAINQYLTRSLLYADRSLKMLKVQMLQEQLMAN